MPPATKLDFDPEAIKETRAARAWYGERSQQAERAFLVELRRAIQWIREAPECWPEFQHGTRRFVLNRFPFSVVYRVVAGKVQVVALAHDKRRPGYWKRR